MTYRRFVPVIIFLLLLLSSSRTSLAQAQAQAPGPAAASISGVFTVVNGGGTRDAAPDVSVKLTGPEASDVRTTTTDGEGHYAFLQLVPGKYTLEANEE